MIPSVAGKPSRRFEIRLRLGEVPPICVDLPAKDVGGIQGWYQFYCCGVVAKRGVKVSEFGVRLAPKHVDHSTLSNAVSAFKAGGEGSNLSLWTSEAVRVLAGSHLR